MRLKDYIQGNRRGKEANRLEREAMSDPFLQEAMDGFDAVAGNHAQIIERLEKRYTRPNVSINRYKNLLWYGSVAASILLLVGVGAYFFLKRTEQMSPIIAMNQPNENVEVVSDNSMSRQLAQKEEQQQEIQALPTMRAITSELEKSTEIPQINADMVEILDVVADVVAVEIFEDVVAEVAADEILPNRFVESSAKTVAKSEQKIPAARGKVVDETGAPIPGVSIVAKGTNTGTITDLSGNFAIPVATDTSKLLASFIGYETLEIKPSGDEQTVMLKSSDAALSEVVVVGYGTQRRRALSDAVPKSAVQSQFGEKEFQTYCQQNGKKNVCNGKSVSVKLSFSIDKNGKPTDISYKNYSCEEAKKEMERLLSSSPAWTVTKRKVTVTIEWQ